jgi:hypothetical protein
MAYRQARARNELERGSAERAERNVPAEPELVANQCKSMWIRGLPHLKMDLMKKYSNRTTAFASAIRSKG